MTNLMKIEQNLTMTSREIAELIEKQHSHIKVSAERLAQRGVIGTLAMREFTHNGNNYTEYLLNKRDSLVLVAQNCPEFTARIIDRWQELEGQVQKPMTQIELILASATLLANMEKRQLEVEQKQQQVQTKLLQIDNKITTGLEEVKETNLLTSCPTVAESITGIRLRMNEDYGLSASVVDAVMRQSLYAPKPVGMVRNQHEQSGGSTYAIYWKKDISNVFKTFVGECKQVQGRFVHPFIKGKFKLNK